MLICGLLFFAFYYDYRVIVNTLMQKFPCRVLHNIL
jgi:hypothetical protein